MFRKKKDKSFSYQIIGHYGIRDGAILEPNERFTRSWTILNSAPILSKEKGKVVKLVHSKGIELRSQLLFLWPVPGKLVTFSLDLVAPNKPGYYESYWIMEGASVAEFWVKFTVENPKRKSSMEIVGNMKKTQPKRKKESLKKYKKLSNSYDREIRDRAIIDSKFDRRYPNMNERAASVASSDITGTLLPPMSMSYDTGLNDFDKDYPEEEEEEEEHKEERKEENIKVKTKHKLKKVGLSISRSKGDKKLKKSTNKKSKQKKRNSIKILISSEDNNDTNDIKLRDIKSKREKTPSLVERWQESITNRLSKELTDSEIKKKETLETVKNEATLNNKHLGNILKTPRKNNFNMFASSRRLTVEKFAPSKTRLGAITDAENSISSYKTMSSIIEGKISDIIKKYPDQENLVSSLNESLTVLNNLIPLLNNNIEQLKHSEKRIQGNSSIGGLDDKLWKYIFSFLPIKDLGKLSCVCRDWNVIVNNNDLWNPQLKLHYPSMMENPFCDFASNFSSKHLFKIECLYGNWFATSAWNSEKSQALADFSFNWPVYDLEIVDDTLVTVSDCLRVFDLKKNKSIASLAGHTKVVNCVKLATNGESCITGSVDKTVKLWSLTTKDCWNTLEGHEGPITAIEQTINLIISCCVQDKKIKFWSKKQGDCIHTIDYPNAVVGIESNLTDEISSNNIYFAHTNGIVTNWDVEAQKEISSVTVSDKSIEGLQVFDNQCIVSDFSKLYIHDFRAEKPHSISQNMKRNVGKVQYDGCKLGAQLGNKLQIFDLRYLFDAYAEISVDNLWKGAFQFNDDYILIGGGDGKTKKWFTN